MVVTDTAGAVLFSVVYFTIIWKHLCMQHLSPRQISLWGQ